MNSTKVQILNFEENQFETDIPTNLETCQRTPNGFGFEA